MIDALDELDRKTRSDLLDALEELRAESPGLVKVFVSSREHVDLMEFYERNKKIKIEACQNQDDIEKFVLSRMQKSKWCRDMMSPALRQKVLAVFQEKSQGMSVRSFLIQSS